MVPMASGSAVHLSLAIPADVAHRVFEIVDENMPLVECNFGFGETTVLCSSRFHFADIQTVIQKATDIMLAARDPLATIRVNGRLILGILLPAAQIEPECPIDVREVVPGMHYSIAEILEWDPNAFVVGNGQWEIGIHFQFGSQHVSFISKFASHLVPNALNMARDICGTLGFWDPDFQGSLIEPLQDPYYFQQLHIPPSYTSFTFYEGSLASANLNLH
jgi:hypothetical protein